MRLVYFASVRETIGRDEEEVAVPETVATAGALVAWLRERGPEYEAALADRALRIAVDQVHARPDAPIAGAREVALFPPMTGG